MTDARRVTGASPAADPASVMDTLTSVTRGLEPASAAETTLEETSVTGGVTGQAAADQISNSVFSCCVCHETHF